jgi:hypothetical protein
MRHNDPQAASQGRVIENHRHLPGYDIGGEFTIDLIASRRTNDAPIFKRDNTQFISGAAAKNKPLAEYRRRTTCNKDKDRDGNR